MCFSEFFLVTETKKPVTNFIHWSKIHFYDILTETSGYFYIPQYNCLVSLKLDCCGFFLLFFVFQSFICVLLFFYIIKIQTKWWPAYTQVKNNSTCVLLRRVKLYYCANSCYTLNKKARFILSLFSLAILFIFFFF